MESFYRTILSWYSYATSVWVFLLCDICPSFAAYRLYQFILTCLGAQEH